MFYGWIVNHFKNMCGKAVEVKKSVNYESVDLFLNFLFSHLTIFTAAKLPL